MISTKQLEVLREVEALVKLANLKINQASLPALVSGTEELGCGLSKALAGVTLILKNHDRK